MICRLEVAYEENLYWYRKWYVVDIKSNCMVNIEYIGFDSGTGKGYSSAVWYGNETFLSICKSRHTVMNGGEFNDSSIYEESSFDEVLLRIEEDD